MALNTAACLLALGVAVTLAPPHGHILRLAMTDDPGAILMRRLGPLAVGLLLLLGWMRLAAGDAGVLTDRDRRALQEQLVRLAKPRRPDRSLQPPPLRPGACARPRACAPLRAPGLPC